LMSPIVGSCFREKSHPFCPISFRVLENRVVFNAIQRFNGFRHEIKFSMTKEFDEIIFYPVEYIYG
jgi:hypothetical protein